MSTLWGGEEGVPAGHEPETHPPRLPFSPFIPSFLLLFSSLLSFLLLFLPFPFPLFLLLSFLHPFFCSFTHSYFYFFKKLFILYWSIADYVVMVSGGQQRDSAAHTRVPLSPKLPSHPGCHITLSRAPWTHPYFHSSSLCLLKGYSFCSCSVLSPVAGRWGHRSTKQSPGPEGHGPQQPHHSRAPGRAAAEKPGPMYLGRLP